jgi:predicted GNAT family acetyltransferase
MLLGISSSCRGKGAGTVLVKRLIEEAASEGVKLSLNCEDMRVVSASIPVM